MALKVHSIFTVIVLTVLVQICVSADLPPEDRIDHPCYPDCECKTNGSDFNVLCDGLHIDYVLKGLPIDTTRLTLRYNQSQTVTNTTFKDTNLTNLHSHDVSNSSATIIEDIDLKNTSFEDLDNLHPSSDRLSDTEQLISVITNSPKLRYINIRNNNGFDCNKISNHFNSSGRNIDISCDNNNVSVPVTVRTTDTKHENLERNPIETTPNGSTEQDTNSPEDTWSFDTVESVSINPETTTTAEATSSLPSTTTTAEATSTLPSTTTTVKATSNIPSTTTTIEATSTIPSTTTTIEATSTIPSTTTTVEATSSLPATTIITTISESLLDSTWFIAVVTIVGIAIVVSGLVVGWRYYQKYIPISSNDNDDDLYY